MKYTGTFRMKGRRFWHEVKDETGEIVATRGSDSTRYAFAVAKASERTGELRGWSFSNTQQVLGSKWQYGIVVAVVPLVDEAEATEELPSTPEPQEAPEPQESEETSPEAPENLGEASALAAEIASEIADLEAKRQAYDADALRLQAELYQAEDADADQKQIDRLRQQMHRALNMASSTGEKIDTLRSPAEVQRRIQQRLDRQNTRQRLDALAGRSNTMAAKTPKKNAASLGVPAAYLGDKGSFKPGMDARLKSDLILAILGEPAPNSLVNFSQADAKALFAKFPQWKGFLARKQEILAEKVAKATERKAAAKAKVDAKKSAAKNGEVEDVTPDPKPTPRKRTRKPVAK